ncbi:unnamed protein product, partial [Oppiella nova]
MTDINSGSNDHKSVHSFGNRLAKPLYLQRLENALRLDGLIAQVERTLNDKSLDEELTTNVSKQQSKAVKTRVYNLSKVKKNKKWLKNILLDKSDSSGTDDDLSGDEHKSDDCLREMLRFHRLQKKARKEFEADPQLRQYQNYSTSLISTPSPQHQSIIAANKTANKKPTKAAIKAKKAKPIQTSTAADEPAMDSGLSEVIAAVSTGIDTIAATSATPPTAEAVLLTAIEKPVIKAEKILDDIPYDTQLPKEILQTEESPGISPYVEPSGASTYGKSADVTPVLPDDIFDTEESCGSGSV